MTQIITITPNPAVDVSTAIGKIVPFSKLRCAPAHKDPGGGGINVARVVKRLGGQTAAIYPAGGTTGQLLCHLLERESVPTIAIPTSEETREDFTVFEETTKQQYRFVMPGASLSAPEWQACLRSLENVDPRPIFVVASGSLPPGVPEDFFARVARIAKEMGAMMIVDSSGPPLRNALKEGVYLIKPNLREFQELTSINSTDQRALIEAGRSLIERGFAKFIALTLGPQGALFMSRDKAFRAAGLPIKPASVVGAGDSFLGAMVWSLANNDSLDTALRYGVAAGSAALLSPGTELCTPSHMHHFFAKVAVVEV